MKEAIQVLFRDYILHLIVYLEDGIFDVEFYCQESWYSGSELKEDFITVLPATKINKNNVEDKINIFPNPTTGDLSIILEKSGKAEIRVFNLLGDVIFEESNIQHSGDINLNLSGNPEGIYFIKIYTSDKYFIKKILLRK